MEDLFREILAPLSPTSPNPVSSSLPFPRPSPAQNAETKAAGAAPQIGAGAGDVVTVGSGSERKMGVEMGSGMDIGMDMGMDMIDIGLGVDINTGSGEQWTTSEMDVQRILESLSGGYEAYRQQQVSDLDSIELGWDAFGASEGLGAGVF